MKRWLTITALVLLVAAGAAIFIWGFDILLLPLLAAGGLVSEFFRRSGSVDLPSNDSRPRRGSVGGAIDEPSPAPERDGGDGSDQPRRPRRAW